MTAGNISTFGDLLRRYRLAAGLSQEALAERAGLGVSTIAALERGRRNAPRADTLALLADALGLTAHERSTLVTVARDSDADEAPDSGKTTGESSVDSGQERQRVWTLPVPPTALVGREREETAVGRLLQPDGGARLVTLTGPGGVGKTRLALAVALSLRDAYPDGVVFVDLSALNDAALVAPAVARALGLREEGALGVHELLVAHLRNKRLLLALDNVEQIIEAASSIADLVAACPLLAVLVTSRTALRVRAEQQFRVLPLDTPAGPSPTAAEVASYPAVQLFVARARAVAPEFRLDADNAAAVAEVCRRLDGLPLAIELAAARVTLLPPAALLGRLERRLGLLKGGPRDSPLRQQTLRATIDWSYTLLSEWEQALVRRLSVFSGGCTLEAAEAVAPAAGTADGDVWSGVELLVDHSLLQAVEQPDGEPRFRMLETIREYGLEQLAASEEEEATRRAHAAYYLELAEAAKPQLFGPEQVRWLESLERDHDNLRAALVGARERALMQDQERSLDVAPPGTAGILPANACRQDAGGPRGDGPLQSNPSGITLGVRLAGALWRFWYIRCHLAEGRGWLQEFTTLPARSGTAPPERADALVGLAVIAYAQTDYDQAAAAAEESVALTRALDDRPNLALSLNILGGVARYRSDFARAATLGEECVALTRSIGDRWFLALSLSNLADVARFQGAYVRATALCEESLVLARALGDQWGIAQALLTLGRIARDCGESEGATALLHESLAIVRALGHTRDIALALAGLGDVARAQGDVDRAVSLCEESLALLRPLGDKIRIADVLTALGHARHAQGDDACAALSHGEGLVMFHAIGDRLGVAESLEGLAAVAGRMGAARREQGLAERAVRLLAAAALREAVGSPLTPVERDAHEREVAGLRAALGDARFDEAWTSGQTLSLQQAVDNAAEITS